MLANWDPFAEITRLQNELFRRREQNETAFRPSVDIYEDEQGIHIKADVAGVKPEDLKLEIDNNVLTIRGERKLEQEDKDKGYHRIERSYGTFSRSFALNNNVSSDDVKADYKDGVLNVLLPKKASNAKREIAVNATN